MNVVGLFAGIGGLELGFAKAGFDTALLCESDTECNAILRKKFDGVELVGDILTLEHLPKTDVVTAGFPCQPYSQAGLTEGLVSSRPLLFALLSLIRRAKKRPTYVVLENVPNIVHLDGGSALQYITRVLEPLGYSWAYRVVDTSSFDLPQRRARWFFVASLNKDAATILLEQTGVRVAVASPVAHGFYWTEGNTGLGWADDAVPPLKGGSGLGIPSPPAIWIVDSRRIVTPTIRDAERLQGFDADWTMPENPSTPAANRRRWRMIGNAVSVPTAKWIAERIALGLPESKPVGQPFLKSDRWPKAAWGQSNERYAVEVSTSPLSPSTLPILKFINDEPVMLSARATRGFRTRLAASNLRYPRAFLADLKHHEKVVSS